MAIVAGPVPAPGDGLVVVDVQADFLPRGALAVAGGDEVIPPLNRALDCFERRGLPVFATRDWHPPNHVSFRGRGGPWPAHCVIDTPGARFAADLRLPQGAVIVSKASDPEKDAYSGFDGTELERHLRATQVRRLVLGGLATDYCVLRTVLDALRLGFGVLLLADAVRAVEARPGDGGAALERMRGAGAELGTSDALCAA